MTKAVPNSELARQAYPLPRTIDEKRPRRKDHVRNAQQYEEDEVEFAMHIEPLPSGLSKEPPVHDVFQRARRELYEGIRWHRRRRYRPNRNVARCRIARLFVAIHVAAAAAARFVGLLGGFLGWYDAGVIDWRLVLDAHEGDCLKKADTERTPNVGRENMPESWGRGVSAREDLVTSALAREHTLKNAPKSDQHKRVESRRVTQVRRRRDENELP